MKLKKAEISTWGQIGAAILVLIIVFLIIGFGGKTYAWATKQRSNVNTYIVPPECKHDSNPGQNIPYGSDGIYDGTVIGQNGKETDCTKYQDATNPNMPA